MHLFLVKFTFMLILMRIHKRDEIATLQYTPMDFSTKVSANVSRANFSTDHHWYEMPESYEHCCTIVDSTTQSTMLRWDRQHYHWTVDDWKRIFKFDLSCFNYIWWVDIHWYVLPVVNIHYVRFHVSMSFSITNIVRD